MYSRYKKKQLSKQDMVAVPRKSSVSLKKQLTSKLDKIFSLYIRLRDTDENGYFKCPTCGKIKAFKQADCSHYWSRRHTSTRWNEDNCCAECSHCLTPDALILMKDLTWKKLGDISVGDELFAFDEKVIYKNSRKYRIAKVTYLHREIQDVYEVELANGDKIKTTANHQWLARERGGTQYTWIETQNLWINGVKFDGKHKTGPRSGKKTSIVCKPLQVVTLDKSRESGWIAGMIDADGHITQQNIHNADGTIRYGFRVGVAQCSKYMDICNDIINLLEKFTGNNKTCRHVMDNKEYNNKIKSNYPSWQFLITGSNIEKIQFLQRVRPHKISKVDIEKLGKLKSQYDTEVKSIQYVGKEEIIVMETDTHTFIANGYAMHNCNRFDSSHLDGLGKYLKKKLGEQKFQMLEWQHNQPCKLGEFEIAEMIKMFQKKVVELKKTKNFVVK